MFTFFCFESDYGPFEAAKSCAFKDSAEVIVGKSNTKILFTDWFSHEGFYHGGVNPISPFLKLLRTRDLGPRYNLFWCHFFCETSACLAVLVLWSEADNFMCIYLSPHPFVSCTYTWHGYGGVYTWTFTFHTPNCRQNLLGHNQQDCFQW